MAATTTTVSGTTSGAVSASAKTVTLTAYTRPSNTRGPILGQFTKSGEFFRITDETASPTLGVVRGVQGSLAVAHDGGEGVTYGVPGDMPIAFTLPMQSQQAPVIQYNTQAITVTGTTGTTAATVTIPAPGFITLTGAASSGVNLPIPRVGDSYTLKNLVAGSINVYCVGGTINATTGTTALAVTNTGTLGSNFVCVAAGVWQVVPTIT